MSTTTIADDSNNNVSFTDKTTRKEDMENTISEWIADLQENVHDAQQSERFNRWLNFVSSFHDYSYRNQMLIHLQKPDATHIAGSYTWKNEYNRYIKKGESAIWIWRPIITEKCPKCGNSEWYHNNKTDCNYSDTPASEWDEGLVGFAPQDVYDIGQTQGDEVPSLPNEINGSPDINLDDALSISDEIGVDVEVVPQNEWQESSNGYFSPTAEPPEIKVKRREDNQTLATLLHEYAHAILHENSDSERSIKEIQAEATGYVVAKHFGLDLEIRTKHYLATWADKEEDEIKSQLNEISTGAQQLIKHLSSE